MTSPEVAYIKLVLPQKLAINLDYMRGRTIASDVAVIMTTLWRLLTAAVRRPASKAGSDRTRPHLQHRKAA
jgi:hypothetical protein